MDPTSDRTWFVFTRFIWGGTVNLGCWEFVTFGVRGGVSGSLSASWAGEEPHGGGKRLELGTVGGWGSILWKKSRACRFLSPWGGVLSRGLVFVSWGGP